MPVFYIENRPRNAKYRRMAIVYALDEKNATERLLEKFPDSVDLKFIKETRLINPVLSSTVIK